MRLLIIFGPDAQSVRTATRFDSFQIGSLIVDATKVYAAGAAHRRRGRAVRLLPLHRLPARRSAPAPTIYTGALVVGLNVKRLYALTFGLGAACVGAAGAMLLLLIDVTPAARAGLHAARLRHRHHRRARLDAGALLGGVLIGVDRGAWPACSSRRPRKACSRFALLILVLLFRPQGILAEPRMIARLARRACRARAPCCCCALLVAALLAAPLRRQRLPADRPDPRSSTSPMLGQAWNIMMGFAGQLSLGHALYVGLGAYVTRGAVRPFRHRPLARACCSRCRSRGAAGAAIGFLAFRFGVAGVYFAILTIAFAEFARIGFDHFAWVGGSAGFFLPVTQYTQQRPVECCAVSRRCSTTSCSPRPCWRSLLCRLLLRSRIGYYWLAIREDEEAARALGIDTFRYKMIAVVHLRRHDRRSPACSTRSTTTTSSPSRCFTSRARSS